MEEKATSEEVKALPREAFRKVQITNDERTWAILAHVSILLGAITVGLLGPVAAFVIWLIKKEESDYVAKQAMQSLIYQIVVAVLSWIMWGAVILWPSCSTWQPSATVATLPMCAPWTESSGIPSSGR